MTILPAARQVARAAAIALAALACGLARGEALRVGGTGGALAAVARVADVLAERSPGFRAQVVPSPGTSGGVRVLSQSRLVVAIVSRPLTDRETASGLVATPYARTALAIATRHRPAESLSRADVAAILRGTRTRWPDGTPLRLVLRPPSDSDSAILDSLSPAVAAAHAEAHRREGILVGTTDQETADFLERIPGAVGTVALSLLLAEARPLEALALEGIRPTPEAIASGRYPLVKSYLFVTRGAPSGDAARLIAFALSPEGRRLLAQTGHAPPP